MKERKKGFTLIELLAVIVILAIVALIATPIVLNLIETARKGSFTRSAEGVLKSAKLYYSSSLLDVNGAIDITFNCDNKECISDKRDDNGNPIRLNIDGNMGSGSITIKSDGNISARTSDGINTVTATSQLVSDIEAVKPTDMTLSANSDTTYAKTKSVTVTLKYTGGSGLAAGSIKYGWSTSTSTASSSYTTVSTSATSGTNTTTFVASGSGLSGSYYLWVVPVTYKDNAGNSNTTTVKSTGTFKLITQHQL